MTINTHACLSGQIGQKNKKDIVKLFTHPLDKTNRSRLNHLEFLGFAFTKLGRTMRRYCKKAGKLLTARRGHVRLGPCPSVRLRTPLASGNARKTRREGKERTWMTRVGLPDDIYGEGADSGNGDVVCGVWDKGRHGGCEERNQVC